jgi:hypothetical protein
LITLANRTLVQGETDEYRTADRQLAALPLGDGIRAKPQQSATTARDWSWNMVTHRDAEGGPKAR